MWGVDSDGGDWPFFVKAPEFFQIWMNVDNSYEVFFLAISLLFFVCKLPVFYQGKAKIMAKWNEMIFNWRVSKHMLRCEDLH